MKNLFNTVKMTKLKKNVFDLTHDVKLTCDMGYLVPILAMDCIPGDKHQIGCESLIRFAPMVAPVMHRFDVTMHYFFVPNRILWNNWENFITNTPNPETEQPCVPPYITFTSDNQYNPIGSLADYMGIPFNIQGNWTSQDESVSALPFAAYQKIWWEYYRDQNVNYPEYESDYDLVDGDNTANISRLTQLRKRSWEHDYFTACLPWAQKGGAVNIPLGDVVLKDIDQDTPGQNIVDVNGFHNITSSLGNDANNQAPNNHRLTDMNNNQLVWLDPNGTMEVSPTNINDLRRAFRLQEWLEKAARGGSRYIEWIKVMFGVNSSDKRLQRPEYITGIKTPVVISEVLNTTGETLPQGNMSGHGVSVGTGGYGSYYCEEHGYIIGIMSVMPKPAYMQGIDRHFLRLNDPTEYYFSSFANIGEQEVKRREVLGFTDEGDLTFGYIPRYAEYRYIPNRVCGNFRTDLWFWHQARVFDEVPTLSPEFIECNVDKRIFAVTDPGVNSLYCQVLNKIKSVRPIPKYGTPTF